MKKLLTKIPRKVLVLTVSLVFLYPIFLLFGLLFYVRFGNRIIELLYDPSNPMTGTLPFIVFERQINDNWFKALLSFSWFGSWFTIGSVCFYKEARRMFEKVWENRKKSTCIFFFLAVIAGALILIWPAAYNRYPLFNPDSVGYLLSPSPMYRPIGYNIFISVTTFFWKSIWVPIFIQSLLASFLLMRMSDLVICDNQFRKIIPLGVLISISVFTTLPKYVSTIMPDLFTGLLFLSFLLFLLSPLRIDALVSLVAIGLFLFSHTSHILISILFQALLLPLVFMGRNIMSMTWKRIKSLTFALFFILISICFLNFGYGGGFRLSYQNSANWLLSKMISNGMASKTLDLYCPGKKWESCKYRHEFEKAIGKNTDWFLWDVSSPIYKLGGFEDQREQNEIVAHAFKSFFPEIAMINICDTFRQLVRFNDHYYLKEDIASPPECGIYRSIEFGYPKELAFFMNSRAQSGLPISPVFISPRFNVFLQPLMVLSACAAICFFVYRRKFLYAMILIASFLFVFLNALVTASVIGVFNRFQGRVLWLITYCLFVSVLGFLLKRRLVLVK